MQISNILINEYPGDGVQAITIFQFRCANMTFSDNSMYNRLFKQVVQKGGESANNYIKWFQNSKALTISVGNSYSEDQLFHIFLENLYQGGGYSSQIANHNA